MRLLKIYMLLDVVSPNSYLTFNVNIAHVIGLVNAVYCSELLEIYNKARKKQKLDQDNYFIVNRDYVKNRTSIKLDEQYLCDVSLSKVGLIKLDKTNPDRIHFDVKQFLKIIAEEDSKVLDTIAKKINLPTNERESKELKKAKIKINLKKLITINNVQIAQALESWIDAIFENDKVFLNSNAVKDFQKTLFECCGNDVSKTIEIINTAKSLSLIDCTKAIESYESAQEVIKKTKSKIRRSSQKVATRDSLSDKKF